MQKKRTQGNGKQQKIAQKNSTQPKKRPENQAKANSVQLNIALPVQMEFYATVSSSWWGTTTTPAAAIMRVTETGWDSESVQSWYVKYTGKYQNDLVWAGDYKLDYSKMNVYNESNVTFSLKNFPRQ